MPIVSTVVGALLSGFLQVLFDSTRRKEAIDFFLNRLDKELLKKLKDNLLSLKAVLSDAEEKQFSDPHVRDWVDRLKDAAYDADDILDSIATKTAKHSLSRLDQMKDYASHLIPFVEGVNTKLKKINETLTSLVGNKDLLGLKEGGVGKHLRFSSPTTSLVDMNKVYGRDGDRATIKKFLMSGKADGRRVPVVAIVGMAGLGKTTLAQLLFNDEEVRERFPRRSWAYVSGGLDIYETTKRIYGSLRKFVNNDITDFNLLQLELQDWSSSKENFLLVLDDFWNENFSDWDILTRPFESGTCQGRIIVTTRHQSVALNIRADLTHSLSYLSRDHCRALFSSHAFRSGNPEKHPALKRIGEELADKCKGLPLAAKTLGSLLRCKEDQQEWTSISKSQIWELPNNGSDIWTSISKSQIWELPNNGSEILPALIISYNYLPSHLKRCFAYCSIFPKGWEIEKWRLICLWMAEGLLPQHRTKRSLEEIGAECFQELLSRSFFQFSPRRASSVVVHDLVHDLAEYVAGGFNSKIEDIKFRSSTTPVKPRHVSYQQTWEDRAEKFQVLTGDRGHCKSVRTFLPLRNDISRFINLSISGDVVAKLKYFRHLRVLSLSNYTIIKVPASIEDLKHLRYLDLSSTKISELPAFVVELYNLETLLLSDCFDLANLPGDMSKLVNLRYLDISGCSKLERKPGQFDQLQALHVLKHLRCLDLSRTKISQLPASVVELYNLETLLLSNCINLANLPSNMSKLVNLRYLDINGCSKLERKPGQFDQLQALQVKE